MVCFLRLILIHFAELTLFCVAFIFRCLPCSFIVHTIITHDVYVCSIVCICVFVYICVCVCVSSPLVSGIRSW